MLKDLITYCRKPVHIAPLVVFRALFGAIMFISILRFIWKGWVYDLYIAPKFFFSYYGFEWVKPFDAAGMYTVFVILAVSALFICLGLFYRISAISFFLTFTYVELLDKSNYLNHYYFVSIIAFLLILVPAGRYFSLDVKWRRQAPITNVPLWIPGIFKLQLGLVYFFAGLAKLNYDWMVDAMPLRIWLPSKAHLPLIGPLLDQTWIAYAASWFGAVYDLSIPFLLINKRTRVLAFGLVLFFHMLTAALFQIGMFPYIMSLSALIFFPEGFHLKLIRFFSGNVSSVSGSPVFKPSFWLPTFLAVHFFIQVLLPFRFMLYPGKLFWTEEGYRFSWRVMLMEKAGHVTFHIKDEESGRKGEAMHQQYLTPNQEKMMSTQPDMILQFAHFLKEEYKKQGLNDPQIFAETYVSLNGGGARLYLDSSVNLAMEKPGLKHKNWIRRDDE